MILGLKGKGGVAGFSGFRGDLSVCGGLNFSGGGFGFRRRKSPPVAYESTSFQKISPAAGHFPGFYSKFIK